MPEAGWVLASAAQGQGFGSEAVQRMHQWADEVKGWSETVCLFDPEHSLSQNVDRKVGYNVSGEAVLNGEPTLVMRRLRGAGRD